MGRLRQILLAIVLGLSILLTGCVDYDASINFAGQNHGEIVQHIHLDEQLTNFGGDVAKRWLTNIEQRTRRLGGRIRKTSSRDITAIIPFNNGAELEAKFNEFFSPAVKESDQLDDEFVLPTIEPHLHLVQHNFLVVEQNILTFDLDLRPLGLQSSEGSLLVSPGTLIDLQFSLDTPWGAQNLGDGLSPQIEQDGKHLTWTLTAGELHHLNVAFWVPSPLGIGSVAIALFVAFGFALRSLLFPQQNIQPM